LRSPLLVHGYQTERPKRRPYKRVIFIGNWYKSEAGAPGCTSNRSQARCPLPSLSLSFSSPFSFFFLFPLSPPSGGRHRCGSGEDKDKEERERERGGWGWLEAVGGKSRRMFLRFAAFAAALCTGDARRKDRWARVRRAPVPACLKLHGGCFEPSNATRQWHSGLSEASATTSRFTCGHFEKFRFYRRKVGRSLRDLRRAGWTV
jgi:hypothetical protein